MDEDMSMEDSPFGLQPAFEEKPRQQAFNGQINVGDPGRKQLQVLFFITVVTDQTTDDQLINTEI
jgi:hypothetical protein